MKNLFFSFILLFSLSSFSAQEKKVKLYNPSENAEKALKLVLKKAKAENKKVLIQAGGNWCVWCIRFNQFANSSAKISRFLQNNYIVYHLNYSPENKNEKTFKRLGNPDKLGFPVFVILDVNGNIIATQESGVLEEGKSYNEEKIYNMLSKWAKVEVI